MSRAFSSARVGRVRAGPARLPGRDEDVRRVLGLLDDHRVVAVVGGRGAGKSMLLRSISALYGVELSSAFVEEVRRGDLVVLDDVEALDLGALRAFTRRALRAEARLLLAVRDASMLPRGAAAHRLSDLAPEDALLVFRSRCPSFGGANADIVGLLGGHPGLVVSAADACASAAPRRPPVSVLIEKVSALVREEYLSRLPIHVRRAAAMLGAAGGWLPREVGRPRYAEAIEILVSEGLAGHEAGGVTASALITAAFDEAPGGRTLRDLLEAVRSAAAGGGEPLALLAEAHLLHHLGKGPEAAAVLRSAYRALRGRRVREAHRRSLLSFALSSSASLRAMAGLALTVTEEEWWSSPLDDAPKESPRCGDLPPEEDLELRIRAARGAMADHFSSELRALADEAAASGDHYGRAHAMLRSAWLHCLRDEHGLAREPALSALRLARRERAAALQGRSLFCLARCDAASGDLLSALGRLEAAARLCRRHRLHDDLIPVLNELAELALGVGRPSDAASCLDEADGLMEGHADGSWRAELLLTRAEVAMRRGHARRASRLLASRVLGELGGGNAERRRILSAEVALATGDPVSTQRMLEAPSTRPVSSRSLRRRRVALQAALVEEGFHVEVWPPDCLEDPVAAVMRERALGRHDAALEYARGPGGVPEEDDPEGALMLSAERARIFLLSGELEEGLARLRAHRERLLRSGPPTALVLILDSIDHLMRSEPRRAAARAVSAHRSARALGHEHFAAKALECLILSHLAMGRLRGLRHLFYRGLARARASGGRRREGRLAAYRVAAQLRAGASPSRVDLDSVRRAGDPLLVSFVDLLRARRHGRRRPGEPLNPLVRRLRDLVLTGSGADWTSEESLAAVELRIDGRRKQATLAGGKSLCFARRRVLWRLLWKLWEGRGRTVEADALYRCAWELPFNRSRLNSLYVGVRRLRLLVEPDPSSPRIILAGPRGGYFLDHRRVEAEGPSPLEEGR